MHPALKVAALGIALVAGFYGPQAVEQFKSVVESHSPDVNLDDYCMLSTTSCEQDSVAMTLEHENGSTSSPNKNQSGVGRRGL